MSNLRILFWSDTFYPLIGGAEILGAELLRALRGRGYDLVVVTGRKSASLPEYEKLWDIPIYRFPSVGVLQANDLGEIALQRRYIAQLKREFRPDIVHLFQFSVSAFFDLLTNIDYPAPHLLTLHGSVQSNQITPGTIRRHLIHSVDWITTCSEALLREVHGQMPEVAVYSSAIRNCIQMPALEPEPLSFSPPRLLCLGRVVPQKGFDVALAAFAQLVPRFPGIRLTIAGDGKEKPALEAMAHQLGVANSVEFPGWVQPEDVPALINACTLVVMPSRIEPFGIVALQAAQMARPIVVTRVGGLPEVVVDSETGMLIESGDVEALVANITFLLNHPDDAARMGQSARRRVQEDFCWNKFVDAYESLYRRLLNRYGGGSV